MSYARYHSMAHYKLKLFIWLWLMLYIILVRQTHTFTTSTTTPTTPTTTTEIPFDHDCSVGNCASSLICDPSTGKCVCLSDQYYNSVTKICLQTTELDHGAMCQNSGSSNECRLPNTICTSDPPSNTNNKCLCAAGFYWADISSSCLSRSTLNIAVSAATRETRRITFSWTDISQRSDVGYTISWDGSNTKVATKTGVTVDGLEPGKLYSFTVVTTLPADGNYPLLQVNQTPVTAWTLPDTPGPVNKPQRVGNAYEVTFGPSAGTVTQYTMTVSNGISFVDTQSSTSTVIRFTNLQPATTYSYSLWSSNGNPTPDTCIPVNGSFTTDPEATGPVDGLNIIGVQSHTANVTWRTPQKPNGNIAGYLVEISLKDTAGCWYFKIPCHSCAELVMPANASFPNCTLVDGKASGNGDAYNLELVNLKPYRNYIVKVQAVNEKGLGVQTPFTFQTDTSVPHDLSNLRVNSVRNEATQKVDLYITWTPGELTGPTVYYILVQEALGLDTDAYNQSVSPLTVTGYSNTRSVKDDVLGYWNYNVSVWAQTDKGNSSYRFELYTTVENDPGPVENLNVAQDPTIANNVTLTFECPVLKSRNGRIETFVISQTLLNPQAQEVKENVLTYNYSATVGQPKLCSQSYTVPARKIIVERNYSFTVMTVNNKYEGVLSNTFSNFEVPPQVPRPEMLKELLQVDSLVKPPDTSTEQTKITTVVCSSCLTDDRWGSVKSVGLLVCVKGNPSCTQTGRKKRSVALEFGQFPSWATAKQQGFKTVYRTTPDKWTPPVSGTDKFNKFVVGENNSCNAADLTGYCNGPLPADKEFYISVIMCTTAGCTVYPETSIFRTATPHGETTSQVGAIVGGVLGGLALVSVIAVIFYWIGRRQARREKTEEIRHNPKTQVTRRTKHNPREPHTPSHLHTPSQPYTPRQPYTPSQPYTPRQPAVEHVPLPQMRDSSHIYDEIGNDDYIDCDSVHPYKNYQPHSSVMKDAKSHQGFHKGAGGSTEHFPYENVI